MSDIAGWSCDERDRKNCRNGHGCHCREITDLMARIDTRAGENKRLVALVKSAAKEGDWLLSSLLTIEGLAKVGNISSENLSKIVRATLQKISITSTERGQ